ncbi:MAG: hypothetical protein H6830_06065 [Planctomycetes bacterium]|nr:hypothetical protein [Planctomycetota bacterium]MCB9909088.1 hypothetical protein [Planctomycetota bacterium]MCB9911665.1 hypothetical protein [Planctomycetota bacterium]HPF14521.1 hypothetical protein [Planctomycetota bacterium]
MKSTVEEIMVLVHALRAAWIEQNDREEATRVEAQLRSTSWEELLPETSLGGAQTMAILRELSGDYSAAIGFYLLTAHYTDSVLRKMKVKQYPPSVDIVLKQRFKEEHLQQIKTKLEGFGREWVSAF